MKKILSGLAAGALAMGLLAGSAFAAVTFDPATGAGYVGKGDVQTAMGWNNADLQKNAGDLVFTYKTKEVYAITVTWTTGDGKRGEKTHDVEHERISSINATIDFSPKSNKQISGFNLKYFTDEKEVTGKIPQVGEEFPGQSGHIVSSVDLVSSTSGLYVNGVQIQ
ncbi:hypothetical protein [Neobacillus piezotolerans]|uniref:hypothetical protein n=1 Tax=Neobacillus piezotolerans TaxID=2259171 RepID=UPI0011578BF4|nr:hypothetical protein [Neobacillus piezotolerans]